MHRFYRAFLNMLLLLSVYATAPNAWAQEGADSVITLNQACMEGSAQACNQLGVKYASGEGVAQDLALAAYFL